MKKLMITLVICAVILTGCGSSGVSQEEYDKVVAERDELKESVLQKEDEEEILQEQENSNIDGFEKAEYEKFNSYASENGLDGTPIYIEGEVISQTIVGSSEIPLLSIIVEQNDGNRWCVAISSDSKIDAISYKNIRAFGMYGGFSDVFNLPTMIVATEDIEKIDKFRIELEKNGEYIDAWNFSDCVYAELYTEEKENNTMGNNKESENGEIEILAEYTLSDSMGWYTRHFIVLKNNSNETVDISTSSLAYSDDDAMVSAANGSLDALGAGCISVTYEAFETDKEISYYETEITFSKSEYYKSVIQDLSYVQNDIDKGAIFQVTNNGTESARFVEGYALFFLNGKLIGYDSTYFTDDDSEIKPEKTISKQLTTYKDYDTIEFYLTGRR